MNACIEAPPPEYQDVDFNLELETLTRELKDMGRQLAPGLLSREAYREKNATLSILFLIDIQKWKSLCFGKQGDFLQLDTPEIIANVFYDFFHEATADTRLRILGRITPYQAKAAIMAQFLSANTPTTDKPACHLS